MYGSDFLIFNLFVRTVQKINKVPARRRKRAILGTRCISDIKISNADQANKTARPKIKMTTPMLIASLFNF